MSKALFTRMRNNHKSSPNNSESQFPPILGSIDEICLVTPDIYETINGLQPLGIGPFRLHHFKSDTVSNRKLRGQDADFELLVGFAYQNDLVVEIMQPVKDTDSLMAQYLAGTGGKAGVQHIAWKMDGVPMEERIARMEERGFEVAMEGIWLGKKGHCHFVFFDTLAKGAGTVFETIEFSEDWEEPEGEVYPNPGKDGSAKGQIG